MSERITYEEAVQRFIDQGRDDIELLEEGYISWGKSALFLDKITGEQFRTSPYNIYTRRSKSRKRSYKDMNFTFDEVNQRFIDQGRKDIELCKEGFNGWGKKSKFWDNVVQDHFWSIPNNVYKNKSVHPNRRNEKKRLTCLENHGVDHPLKSKEIQEKKKQTCLEKYDVENPILLEWVQEKARNSFIETHGSHAEFMASEYFREKSKQTNLEKLGVENPLQSLEIQEKVKTTNMERYDAEWPLGSDGIKEKIIETNLERYNVENPFAAKEIQDQIKETCLEKYGEEYFVRTEEYKIKTEKTCLEKFNEPHFSKTDDFKRITSKRWIKGLNIHLSDWIKQNPELKISYMTLYHTFPNEEIEYNDLLEFVENYKDNKTKLEVFAEKLFGVKHYNRKPKNISKLYKPDFKLSDKIYVNVDGLYWHSEKNKGKDYHFNLRKEFEDNGLKILQFYDYEIYNKSNIVKSIVNSYLTKFGKEIKSKDCDIKIINSSVAAQFFNENSLKTILNYEDFNNIALYYNEEIVSCLSYRITSDAVVEIINFYNKININVINSFIELINFIPFNHLDVIVKQINYTIDLRYENELILNGFKKVSKDKMNFQLLNENKIWDAGQRTYIKIL